MWFVELELGELIHHQKLFGLFEAMSAIEMMDPKMDAGMCCNKNSAPLTYEVAVQVKTTKPILACILHADHFNLVNWISFPNNENVHCHF